jgi:hypothetical protein
MLPKGMVKEKLFCRDFSCKSVRFCLDKAVFSQLIRTCVFARLRASIERNGSAARRNSQSTTTMKPTIRILFAVVLMSAPLHGASVSLHPVADTTLQSAFSGNNFGDGTSFQAGGRRQGGVARGLLQFDIAGSVPAGATVTSVSLSLNVTATPSGGANSIFDLHSVLQSWGEGNNTDHGGSPADPNEATWNNRFAPGSPWTTPGGLFSATVSASRSIAGNGAYTFASTAQLVSDVQSWLNNPANNFGWELMSESENTPTSIRRFGSRDSGASAPTLTVNYTPVPEPGTIALFGIGGGLALWVAWRRRSRA